MLICPRNGERQVMVDYDYFTCLTCGWSAHEDQVMIEGDKIIVCENPLLIQEKNNNQQKVSAEPKRARQSNPRHGKYPL
ncbi:hypothetical protein LCGC14_0103300 [marine sediment metagenome]|uniref:Uncharacterized protein n=1 Tax=marine sediment metagenome TaxID=412755 RepID=A0A0F9YEL0_9ZZZZ